MEQKKDLEQLSRQLAELYPQDPVGLLDSFHWLYQHPDTANFLCGLESGKTAGEALRELQKEGQREYLSLIHIWKDPMELYCSLILDFGISCTG